MNSRKIARNVHSGVCKFSTGEILKIFIIHKNSKKYCTVLARLWTAMRSLLLFLHISTVLQPVNCLAMNADICGYSNPEYSVYNRLLKVEVNRGGKKVGEVHYSYQFDGYYVRCVTDGVPSKRFFARARDARWAACGSCY